MALKNEQSLREAIAREEVLLAELSHQHNESQKRLASLKAELASIQSTHSIPCASILVQYADRLHRNHPDKTEVRICDSVDHDVPMLARLFE